MNAVDVFCAIAAAGRPVRAAQYAHHVAYVQLIQAGFLGQAGVVQSVFCNECTAPHDAEIVFDDGQYGYFCPDLGFLPISRAQIEAVQPCYDVLVAQLAETLNCSRRKSTPIAGNIWRIGRLDAPSGDVMVYFHPHLKDALGLMALGQEVKSTYQLVLTVSGGVIDQSFKIVSLPDILAFDPAQNRFVVEADLPAIAGVPKINKGGRPNLHRENILKLSQERKKDGRALSGVNAEAKEIQKEYPSRFPNQGVPSFSTIKINISRC